MYRNKWFVSGCGAVAEFWLGLPVVFLTVVLLDVGGSQSFSRIIGVCVLEVHAYVFFLK